MLMERFAGGIVAVRRGERLPAAGRFTCRMHVRRRSNAAQDELHDDCEYNCMAHAARR
jgi:hypothetical protein